MANRYQLVVDLPESDGVLTQGDLHLAETAKDTVADALKAQFPTVEGHHVHVMVVPTR